MSYNTLAGDVSSPYVAMKQRPNHYIRNSDGTSAESIPTNLRRP